MKRYVLTVLLGVAPLKGAHDFTSMCKTVGRAVLTGGTGTGCLFLAHAVNNWLCTSSNHSYDVYCDNNTITPPTLAVVGLSLVPWYLFVERDFPEAVVAVADWVERSLIGVIAWFRMRKCSAIVPEK